MKLIISFIIFLSTLYLVSSQLKLPFQTKFNISNANKDDIMKTLIDNDIFVQISIGSNIIFIGIIPPPKSRKLIDASAFLFNWLKVDYKWETTRFVTKE